MLLPGRFLPVRSGLEYRVDFVPDGRLVHRGNPFRVAPGQEIRLPDVVWREDDGGAGAHRQ